MRILPQVHKIALLPREGKITTHRTEGGHRRYKVADLLQIDQPEKIRFTVCYGRVSTREKKDDLQRQLLVLESFCQQEGWGNIHVLKDIGSGLNYRKKGLLKLVEMLQRLGNRKTGYYRQRQIA